MKSTSLAHGTRFTEFFGRLLIPRMARIANIVGLPRQQCSNVDVESVRQLSGRSADCTVVALKN